MHTTLWWAAAAAAMALLLAVPAQAQDTSSAVTFDGIGFTFDRQLGTSVSVIRVRPGPAEGPGVPEVGHLAFSISDVRRERPTVPGPERADGVVYAYRTADLGGEGTQARQLERLRTLLDERPDPATFMTADSTEAGTLPYLPLPQAAQMLRARARYIDTPVVSGIAYVAAYAQDLARFSAGDFWYTFQGLSTDGAWYIAVDWVLTAPGFPRRATTPRSDTRPGRYERYIERAIARLNAADPGAFSPPLASLDALVRSITIEGVPAEEPSPVSGPSAPPSLSPSLGAT